MEFTRPRERCLFAKSSVRSPPLYTCMILAGLTFLLAASYGQAQSESDSGSSTRFSAELGMGVEYDSNIAVEEVDRATIRASLIVTRGASYRPVPRQVRSATAERHRAGAVAAKTVTGAGIGGLVLRD